MHEGQAASAGDLGSRSEAERACEEGQKSYKAGEFDLALQAFTRAVALNNLDPYAFRWRAATYLELGDHDRAIADCNEAIHLDPKGAASFNRRGAAHYRKGEYDRAIADFSESIRLDPAAVTFSNRGLARSDKGEYDQAIADYDEAIRLDPADGLTYYKRGVARAATGARETAKADYVQALRLGLSDPTKTLAEAGLAQLEKSRFSLAMENVARSAAALTGFILLVLAVPAAIFVGYVVWNFDGIWNIPHHTNKFAVYCLVFLPLLTLAGMVAGSFKLLGVQGDQKGQ